MNEGLVGSIKEDEGFVGTGIIHPAQSSGTPTNPVVTATVTATGITATHSWDPYSTYPDGCFNVQYRDNIDSSSTWVQANADCSQGNNYTVTDLSRNVFYAFRIQRVNQADQRIISTWSAVVTVVIPGEQHNQLPWFQQTPADQKAIEAVAFGYITPEAVDPEGARLTYSAVVLETDGGRVHLSRWLAFDPSSRQFSGTPQQSDAPAVFTIEVTAAEQAPGNVTLTATTSFRLTMAKLQANVWLPDVVKAVAGPLWPYCAIPCGGIYRQPAGNRCGRQQCCVMRPATHPGL